MVSGNASCYITVLLKKIIMHSTHNTTIYKILINLIETI